MKKLLSAILAVACVAAAFAFPKAFYVKKGDSYIKYNFGVAGDLLFSNDGRTLTFSGYGESVDLDQVDAITFTAPVDQTAMTPSESKEKLIAIGEEVRSKIDLNDQKDIVELVDNFVKKYGCYYLPESYYNVYNFTRVMKGIGSMAKGNLAAARKVRSDAADLYQIADFFGVYEARPLSMEWVKVNEADYLELRFPTYEADGTYTVKITQSKEYTDWTEVDFVGRVPSWIKIEVKRDQTLLTKVDMDFTVDNTAKSLHLDLNASLQSDYKIEDKLSITSTAITDFTRFTIKGEDIITANAVIHGQNLTNYDQWNEEVEKYEETEYYDEELDEWITVNEDSLGHAVARHFTYATASLDVIGKLQIKGRVSQFEKAYDQLSQSSRLDKPQEIWNEETNTMTIIYDDIEVIDAKVGILNNYSDLSFYYDKSQKLQGYLTWDVDEDIDRYMTDGYWDDELDQWVEKEHWREWIDYEIMPLLTFPDMTTFAIEDYFDEDSFESLLTDYETLGDTYKDLVGAREYNRVAGYWREERNDDAYVCYDFYKDGGVYYHYSHSWYDEETHEYHYNSVSKDGRYTYDEENETVTVHYTSCYDDTHDDWYTIDESHTYTVEFYRDKMILKEGTQTIVLE